MSRRAKFGPSSAVSITPPEAAIRGWRIVSERSCRKKSRAMRGGETVLLAGGQVMLGTFTRPCATPGCRGLARVEVSLAVLAKAARWRELGAPMEIHELDRTHCRPCVARRAQRTPEERAAARREATRQRVARWRAARSRLV